MTKTKSATTKQRRSSRIRNDNRPWGWQPSAFSRRALLKIERDVKAGILPKSALSMIMKIIGRKKEAR